MQPERAAFVVCLRRAAVDARVLWIVVAVQIRGPQCAKGGEKEHTPPPEEGAHPIGQRRVAQ